jgi:ribonuclease-3
MDNKVSDQVSKLEEAIGYIFKKKDIVIEAITHPSCHIEITKKNNERLEFLGDAVLNLIIAEILYEKYNDSMEDKLSSMRAKLISCDAICLVAGELGIKEFIMLSQGEEKNGGRNNPRNIENATEAIIGALYIDAGFEKTKAIISKHWKNLIENQTILGVDAKTILQEWAQKNKYGSPIYKVLSREGPSHAPEFEISVSVGNIGVTKAKGFNKKETEKLAALDFLHKFVNQ